MPVESKNSSATTVRGIRVRLLSTTSVSSEVTPGDEGTVRYVNRHGIIHVDWDNGGLMGLVPVLDTYEVIPSTVLS